MANSPMMNKERDGRLFATFGLAEHVLFPEDSQTPCSVQYLPLPQFVSLKHSTP